MAYMVSDHCFASGLKEHVCLDFGQKIFQIRNCGNYLYLTSIRLTTIILLKQAVII